MFSKALVRFFTAAGMFAVLLNVYVSLSPIWEGTGKDSVAWLSDAPTFYRPNNTVKPMIPLVIGQQQEENVTSQWRDAEAGSSRRSPRLKIAGFSDISYWPVTRRWYDRLTSLGYSEHVIVAIDKMLISKLEGMEEYRFEPYLAQEGSRRSLWYRRVEYVMENVQNGSSVLLSDVDNIFSRYVPLDEFQSSGYDVIHAYEGRFPVPIFRKQGFVVCAGMAWFTATASTFRFLSAWRDLCWNGGRKKCNDQVTLNTVLTDSNMAPVKWRWTDETRGPNARRNDDGLLSIGMVGNGIKTNHTVKIWDRDFAWRGNTTQMCPNMENNWVAMPGPLSPAYRESMGKIAERLERLDYWEEFCGPNGTRRQVDIQDPGLEAFHRAQAYRKKNGIKY